MRRDSKINVLVMHKEPVVASGLAAILGAEPDIFVLENNEFSTTNFGTVSDVLVTDYDTGIKLAEKYRGHTRIPESAPRIMIVTSINREWEIHSALNFGVHGYVLQCCSKEELILASRTLFRRNNYVCQAVAQDVLSGLSRVSLTPRETDVLGLLVKGACNRSIATRLGITIHTTKAHVRSILEKLCADSRTEAAAIATRRGLVCDRLSNNDSIVTKSQILRSPENRRPHLRQETIRAVGVLGVGAACIE